MLLERISLCDVGVFRGQHVFDIAPRKKWGQTRPVILFGGLNGAGKTTLLTAVRLALYGRQALGFAIAQKGYHEFLRELIHRNRDSLVPTVHAHVGLEFTYSHTGSQTQYRIARSWEDRGRTVDETIRLFRDSEEVAGLSYDQAQAFLNHLVPPGVSQFFFFDGEKIAALAADQADDHLGDSVRQLLGLDVVAKLRADLTVLLRQSRSEDAGAARGEHEKLELDLRNLEQEVEKGLAFIKEELDTRLAEARQRADRIRADLAQRGGAWAADRASQEQAAEALASERRNVEHDIRELLAEHVPFGLAPKLSTALCKQLRMESDALSTEAARRAVRKKTAELQRRLARKLPKQYRSIVSTVLKDLLGVDELTKTQILHRVLTEADRSRTERLLTRDVPTAVAMLRKRTGELVRLEERITDTSRKLAMAPSDISLDTAFRDLEAASEEIGRLTQQRRAQIEELRRKTWLSIDIVRKLRRLEEKIRGIRTSDKAYSRAQSLLEMLHAFAQRLTRAKVEVLRRNFVAAFARLARKEDLVSDAQIDTDTFAVTLIDKRGNSIPKERLSAGEKQIYAIAMLEALAKTSGRNLPVIIDTPLGRLDSRHRRKLVEQYFPHASHQVIVLSTDTEVDEPFYMGLSKHVSHAYHLQFDESVGATRVDEGYFWRSRSEEVIRAA